MRLGRPLWAGMLIFLAALVGFGGEADLAPLIAKLREGDLEARQTLVAAGIAAVGPLLAHVGDADPRCRAEMHAALRWIVERTPQARRAALADALAPFTRAGQPTSRRRAAIDLLGRVAAQGHVAALAPLLRDHDVREHAAAALARVPGRRATRALARALRAADEAFRPVLLAVLGARGDERAAGPIARYLDSEDEATAAAAAEALGRIGAASSREPLLNALDARSPKVQAAVFDACLALADAHRRRAVRQARGAPSLPKGGETDAAGAIVTEALSRAANANQQADALRALASVASPASLETIRPYLASTRPEVQRAACAVLCCVPGEAGTRAVAEAAPKAPAALRPMLIRALGARRHKASLDALIAAAKEPDDAIAVAALAALRMLPDTGALPTARMLAEQGRTEAIRSAALEAYLALGQPLLARGDAERARKLFDRAYALATRDAERAQALAGLAVVGGPTLLPRLIPMLKTARGDLLAAATDTTLAIADRLADTDRDAAIAAYRQILDSGPPHDVARQTLRRLHGLGVHVDLAGRQGFITTWWVIGHFDARNYKAASKKRFPEDSVDLKKQHKVGSRTVRWRRIHGDDPRGIIDLRPLFGKKDLVVAYAYAELTSPAAQDVLVKLARDDGLTVWLNGQRIYDKMDDRGGGIDAFTAKAKLDQGLNRILVKCANGRGGWIFALRITDPKGTPLRVDHMLKR